MENIESIYPILTYVFQYWYFAIPISIALLLGSRWFPQVIIAVVGLVGGMFFLWPFYLKTIPFIEEFITNNPSADIPLSLVTGVIIGALLFALFKFFFLITGVVFGFFLGLWLFNMISPTIIDQIQTTANFTVPSWASWVVAGVFAVLIGIFAWLSHEKTMSFISIFVGAFILDFFILFGLCKLFPEFLGTFAIKGNIIERVSILTPGLVAAAFILLLLIVTGYFLSRKRKT